MTKAEFAEIMFTYRNGPIEFFKDVLGVHLIWSGQKRVLTSVKDHKITVVPSGHSCSKSATAAGLTLWWMSTRFKPRVIVTAPTYRQLFTVFWAELSKWYTQSDLKHFELFDMTSQIMRFNDVDLGKEWYTLPISPKTPDALQGQHGDKNELVKNIMEAMGIASIDDDATIREISEILRGEKEFTGLEEDKKLLIIIDESSGVKDEIIEVLEGTDYDKLVAFGNMTRTEGFFYEMAYNIEDDDINVERLNSEDSPFMSKAQIESIARRYGKESNVYKVRVKGDAPDSSDKTVIPRSLVDSGVGPEKAKFSYLDKEIMGVDVARYGDDHTIGYKNTGSETKLAFEYEKKSTMNCVGEISRWCQETPEKDHYLLIDGVGVGGPVIDRLRELEDEDYTEKDNPDYTPKVPNLVIYDINNGSSKVFEPNEFANVITEMFYHLKEELEAGDVVIPDDKELIQELSVREYDFKSDGTIIVEKKDKVKEKLKRSPDKGDAFLMARYGNKFI